MRKVKIKAAEDQAFQDILLCGGDSYVEICILPHLGIILSAEEVAMLLSLMKKASRKNASYDDQNANDGGVRVERMKDDSTLVFGGFAMVRHLTDSQWVEIYKSLKKWQAWVVEDGDGEWRAQIQPDHKAFAMFDENLSEEERHGILAKMFVGIFDDDGVSLS